MGVRRRARLAAERGSPGCADRGRPPDEATSSTGSSRGTGSRLGRGQHLITCDRTRSRSRSSPGSHAPPCSTSRTRTTCAPRARGSRRVDGRHVLRTRADLDDRRAPGGLLLLDPHGDRVRLPGDRRGSRRRSRTATTRSYRAASCSWRSSWCSSTCSSTSRTGCSTRGSDWLAGSPVSIAEMEARELELEPGAGGLWRDALHRTAQSRGDRRLRARRGWSSRRSSLARAVRPDRAEPRRDRGSCCPGPSREHLLGVDDLGRDELSRLIYGARYSLLIGVVAVTVGLSAGLLLGSIAGYFRRTDGLIMRVMDIMLAIPGS